MNAEEVKHPLTESDSRNLKQLLIDEKDSIDNSFTQFREAMQTIVNTENTENTEDR